MASFASMSRKVPSKLMPSICRLSHSGCCDGAETMVDESTGRTGVGSVPNRPLSRIAPPSSVRRESLCAEVKTKWLDIATNCNLHLWGEQMREREESTYRTSTFTKVRKEGTTPPSMGANQFVLAYVPNASWDGRALLAHTNNTLDINIIRKRPGLPYA